MKQEFKKGEPVRVSPNFVSTEFDCRCNYPACQTTIIDLKHVERLQALRDRVGKSVLINSGYRCKQHNRDVGGAKDSRHTHGDATDIVVRGLKPSELAEQCQDFDGVGLYNTFVHVDSRGHKARWDYRS